jgi:tetratricopeptide (TPR) repeat protein
MTDGSDDRLQEAALMIGLLEYDRAEELLLSAVADADRSHDDQAASLALEALGTVATRRGKEADARDLLERAVERGRSPDPAERLQLYWELARIHSGLGDAHSAIALLEDVLERLGPDADAAVRAQFTVALSYATCDAGDYGRASSVLAELVRAGAEDIDLSLRARIGYALARLCAMQGNIRQSLDYSSQSVEVAREAGDEYFLGTALLLQAHLLLDEMETEHARTVLAEARRLFGDRPSAVDLGFVLVEEARCELQSGDADAAETAARDAIELLGDHSVPGQLGDAYLVLARIYDERGDNDRADRAYTSAIASLRRQNGWHYQLAKAYRWYGKFLRRTGRSQAAIELLELAADISMPTAE